MSAKKRIIIEVALFFIVAAVLYLLFANELGYSNDDWYTMYAARVAGPDIFHEIYSIDRPGRAFVMIPLYKLFQGDPFYYVLSAYLFRVLGALSLLWLLRLLWHTHKNETFFMAFLFLIYPGFLDQPIAIDFQSHLMGMFLAFMSLGLMVKALFESQKKLKFLFWLGAVLSGWAYLSQMEYYIAFEGVRLIIVIMIVLRKTRLLKQTILLAVKAWLPYSIVAVFFLAWRTLIFENQRAITDAGAQFSKLFSDPLLTLYTWTINFVESFLNVLVLAWGVPLENFAFSLDLHSSLRGLAISFSVLMITFFVVWCFERIPSLEDEETSSLWFKEAFWLGIIWGILGLLPVILANRVVILRGYSRYGFVSSVGAVITLVAAIYQLRSQWIKWVILAFLVFSSTFVHYANGLNYANFASDLRTFWWQVSWRVPQLRTGTTIVAHYPHGGIRETSFVWGPANHIYYPELLDGKAVQTGVYALMLNKKTVANVITQEKSFTDKYNVVKTYPNYRNILIMTQPSENSCVQIIDGEQPLYSQNEESSIMVIGPYSESGNILVDGENHPPPEFLFGPEPAHGWCYIYQKATLARQRGDWDLVYALDAEASQTGSVPQDVVEWLPFIQASAMLGDEERIQEIAPAITSHPFVAQQVCEILLGMELSPEMRDLAEGLYCIAQ